MHNTSFPKPPSLIDPETPPKGPLTPSPGNSSSGTAAISLFHPSVHSYPEDVTISLGKRPHKLYEMFGLFGVSFSYALLFSTINTLVIPHELERITSYRTSMWLGCIMGAGALSQLCSPAVGAWSDRLGRRMPFLIYGGVLTVVGVILFLVLKSLPSLMLLFTALVVTTCGLSMQYSMLTALLSDCIPDEQIGKGSAVLAVLAILGSGFGYGLFAMEISFEYLYCTYILSTVLCLGLSVMFIPATLDAALGSLVKQIRKANTSISCGEIVRHSLTLPSPTKHRDFTYACIGRCLFNVGVSGQVYLAYYYRDIVKTPHPLQTLSYVSVAVLVGSVIAALPSGIMSDRIGKKPVIYAAAAVCITSVVCFMMTINIGSHMLIGVMYGVGNVAYLSVDYALGVNCLPRHEDSSGAPTSHPIDPAKDLGIFAMSCTVGQLFGQVLFGSVLDSFRVDNANLTTRYTEYGFFMVYGMCAVAFLLSAITVKYISCVK